MAKACRRTRLVKRILVPTDGSRRALEAARYAAELARSLGADITLLHVVEMVLPPEAYLDGIDRDRLRSEFIEGGKAILALTRGPVAEAGVPVDVELREGHPGDAIVEMAAQGRYDLIVMGSRGLGLAQKLLLGSVSEHVVRNAPCPVLIVRGDWPGRSAEEAGKPQE